MNSHSSRFAVLVISAFIAVKLHLILADETKGFSCEEYHCKSDYRCYLDEVKCSHPPCPKLPTCRPTCPLVACDPNYTCITGECHPLTSCDGYQCEPGRECFMKQLRCKHSNCRKIPSCRPSCQVIRCSSGYKCENGQCIEDKCAAVFCDEGYKCEVGKCVLDESSCKGVVCAFGDKCYLEDQDCDHPPCPKIPECRPSCDLVDCRTGYFCRDGKCILDRCAIVRCQGGFKCKNGKCIKGNLTCDEIKCSSGEECYIDNTGSFPLPACRPILTCATINCLRGYVCRDNKCIPEPTCDGIACETGEECHLQQVQCIQPPCYPVPVCEPILTCATILCQTGYYCVNNKCIQEPTCEGVKCENEEECILQEVDCFQAPCPPLPTCWPIDKCSLIRCRSGYQCVDGNCIKAPSCEDHHCRKGNLLSSTSPVHSGSLPRTTFL